MQNDKTTIYNALKEVEGLNVYQKRPVDDMVLPCLTFRRSNVTVSVNLDRELVNQSQSYDIDIFATKQSEVDGYLAEVEEIMRGMGYVMGGAIDLDDPDNIAHINVRFNLS
jgi:hypothetical protein